MCSPSSVITAITVDAASRTPSSERAGAGATTRGDSGIAFQGSADAAPSFRHTERVDLTLLDERLAAHGEPDFRARQVWEWAASGAGSYEQMTNLPLELRSALADEVPFSSLALRREALARDGTAKALFDTGD